MIRRKKSLGQHFLKSGKIIDKIINLAEIKSGDRILEIGPGEGDLTEKLLLGIRSIEAKIIAVEKDKRFYEFLKNKFSKEIDNKKLELINDDILKFNENFLKNYKVIANIPYNITGSILKKFLTAKNQPNEMVLMVQYEVARRIIGKNKITKGSKVKNKESMLSLSVKAYGEPKIEQKVKAGNFLPIPNVDSAIISIKNISREKFKAISYKSGISPINLEDKFWQVVRAGFSNKRKLLISNLKKSMRKEMAERLEKNNIIPKNSRAEDLSIDDWFKIIQI